MWPFNRKKPARDLPLDYVSISCDYPGLSTLVEVEVYVGEGTFPVRLLDEERPGSVQVYSKITGQNFHSIAPPILRGYRGREIDGLTFAVYIREKPKNIGVRLTYGLKTYGTIKSRMTEVMQ